MSGKIHHWLIQNPLVTNLVVLPIFTWPVPKKLIQPLTYNSEKLYLLKQTISAGDGSSRNRALSAVACSFGLPRERRIVSPLSGASLDTCHKIIHTSQQCPVAALYPCATKSAANTSIPNSSKPVRGSPISTPNQPTLSTPLSSPKPRTAFPPQPASPLTPSWTESPHQPVLLAR